MSLERRRTDEADLRRAVLRGDRHAWRILYDRSFDPLAVWARHRFGGNGEGHEEILQEAWLVAVKRIRDFDPDRGSFLAWLCGIARRTAGAVSRSKARRPETLIVDPEEPRRESPEVGVALASIPADYREVLVAKYSERKSVTEIAAESGVTPKAVESKLSRARAAFREAWKYTLELP